MHCYLRKTSFSTEIMSEFIRIYCDAHMSVPNGSLFQCYSPFLMDLCLGQVMWTNYKALLSMQSEVTMTEHAHITHITSRGHSSTSWRPLDVELFLMSFSRMLTRGEEKSSSDNESIVCVPTLIIVSVLRDNSSSSKTENNHSFYTENSFI